jgi:hypothetical protein
LPKFFETEMRMRDTSKAVTVNLDHLIQVTVGDEGRAVVHLSGAGSFTTDAPYADSQPDWRRKRRLSAAGAR